MSRRPVSFWLVSRRSRWFFESRNRLCLLITCLSKSITSSGKTRTRAYIRPKIGTIYTFSWFLGTLYLVGTFFVGSLLYRSAFAFKVDYWKVVFFIQLSDGKGRLLVESRNFVSAKNNFTWLECQQNTKDSRSFRKNSQKTYLDRSIQARFQAACINRHFVP